MLKKLSVHHGIYPWQNAGGGVSAFLAEISFGPQ